MMINFMMISKGKIKTLLKASSPPPSSALRVQEYENWSLHFSQIFARTRQKEYFKQEYIPRTLSEKSRGHGLFLI